MTSYICRDCGATWDQLVMNCPKCNSIHIGIEVDDEPEDADS